MGRNTLVVVLLLLAGIAGFSISRQLQTQPTPDFNTPFQAVLLSNGQVYYGKVGGLGTDYLILREVYYIQSKVNPDSKDVVNTLVRRGKELHGPDLMVVNSQHVLLVESVSPDSQVAKLIAEAARQ